MNVWMDGGRMMNGWVDGWRRSWLNESPHRDPGPAQAFWGVRPSGCKASGASGDRHRRCVNKVLNRSHVHAALHTDFTLCSRGVIFNNGSRNEPK